MFDIQTRYIKLKKKIEEFKPKVIVDDNPKHPAIRANRTIQRAFQRDLPNNPADQLSSIENSLE